MSSTYLENSPSDIISYLEDGSMIINGAKGRWEVIIGLEIHAQINTKSKLFSGASCDFGASANSNVADLDASLPGSLPILNIEAVRKGVLTGLAINGKVANFSVFDRKHYFYPDLPLGYQITQFYHPLIKGGHVHINSIDNKYVARDVGICSIHLEQDAGKSIHDDGFDYSYIDLNRAGVPLMEIITHPELRSHWMVIDFITHLRNILIYINVCDGSLENGSMRCDANVSVMPIGSKEFGTRCEIKNLNSMSNIAKAIQYEAKRQVNDLEDGKNIAQETRLFNPDSGTTHKMRNKENSNEYCYFPDPDLTPVILDEKFIHDLKLTLPRLPQERKKQYCEEFKLNEVDAIAIISDKNVAEYFEKTVSISDPKMTANWILVELFGQLNKCNIQFVNNPISADNLAALVNLIQSDYISGKIAKQIFIHMFEKQYEGKNPKEIVDALGLAQVSDVGFIRDAVAKVFANNPDKLDEYRAGKHKLLGFFVGQVMQETSGRASPSLVNKIIMEELDDGSK